MTILDIAARVQKSRNDFSTRVWPVIKSSFPPGTLVPVEAEAAEACRILDIAGIDYIFSPLRGEPYGISQRILSGTWETLTLRPRELARLRSVWGHPGVLAPTLLIHGYVNGDHDRSLDAAVVLQTAGLLEYVKEHPGAKRASQSGDQFLWWPYDDLEVAGVCAFRIPVSTLKDPLGLSARDSMRRKTQGDLARSL